MANDSIARDANTQLDLKFSHTKKTKLQKIIPDLFLNNARI